MLEKLLLCAGTVAALFLPMYIGHGLAIHNYSRMVVGVVGALVAGVIFFLLMRMKPAEDGGHGH